MPKSIHHKLDLGRPSFDETEADDYDDDTLESELELEQPNFKEDINPKGFAIMCGILILPLIFGLAYFLLYAYQPKETTRPPYLSAYSSAYISEQPNGIRQSGPLVGHTTHNSSKIWFYQGGNEPMEIVYWPRIVNMLQQDNRTTEETPRSNYTTETELRSENKSEAILESDTRTKRLLQSDKATFWVIESENRTEELLQPDNRTDGVLQSDNETDGMDHLNDEFGSFWSSPIVVDSSPKVVDLIPDPEANGAAISIIQGLKASTTYYYEIRIGNESIAQGQFKTAPHTSNDRFPPTNDTTLTHNDTLLATNGTSFPRSGASFKYLLASCMNVKSYTQGYMTQPVWDEVMKKNIDFALLPGDTVYMNYKDRNPNGAVKYDRVWFRNLQQRAESHFANFISKVPIYSSWDDHDYGADDADHSQAGKNNSLAAWGHLWPNPYHGTSNATGIYYSYSWGDVDFFVMDCRWYRNSNNNTLFGEPQMEWLKEKLIESNATFKVIVSASDVMERGLTGDLKQLGKLVTKHSISGVVFNSGDIHRNQFKVQKVSNWPYPVVQITSSGIARVKKRPFAVISIDTNLDDPEILTQFYAADSNEHITTWSNNATIDCYEIRKSKDTDLKQRCSKVVRLSDLTP